MSFQFVKALFKKPTPSQETTQDAKSVSGSVSKAISVGKHDRPHRSRSKEATSKSSQRRSSEKRQKRQNRSNRSNRPERLEGLEGSERSEYSDRSDRSKRLSHSKHTNDVEGPTRPQSYSESYSESDSQSSSKPPERQKKSKRPNRPNRPERAERSKRQFSAKHRGEGKENWQRRDERDSKYASDRNEGHENKEHDLVYRELPQELGRFSAKKSRAASDDKPVRNSQARSNRQRSGRENVKSRQKDHSPYSGRGRTGRSSQYNVEHTRTHAGGKTPKFIFDLPQSEALSEGGEEISPVSSILSTGLNFQDIGITCPYLIDKLAEQGFAHPTEVQAKSIPLAMNSTNLVCTSFTGSGKTLAFVLPILDKLIKKEIQQVVILSPTREIAMQTQKVLDVFLPYEGITSGLVVGGLDMKEQRRILRAYPKVFIATPGRLVHAIQEGRVWLNYTDVVILDEIDRMLDMGFKDQLDAIYQEFPYNTPPKQISNQDSAHDATQDSNTRHGTAYTPHTPNGTNTDADGETSEYADSDSSVPAQSLVTARASGRSENIESLGALKEGERPLNAARGTSSSRQSSSKMSKAPRKSKHKAPNHTTPDNLPYKNHPEENRHASIQMLTFTATLLPSIQSAIDSYMKTYETIIIGDGINVNKNIEHKVFKVDYRDKSQALESLLLNLKGRKTIVFFNTIEDTIRKSALIRKAIGSKILSLHSRKSQDERNRALSDFRGEGASIMFATDVAARGIDVYRIEYVINYGVPRNAEEYIHRLGRTGRMNLKGNAITLMEEKEQKYLKSIEKLLKTTIKVEEL